MYGSKAEETFAEENPILIPVHNKVIREPYSKRCINFLDANNEEFRAMADFAYKHAESGLYTLVEYKTDKLNFLKTQIDCDVATSEYRGRSKHLLIRDCSWSNSAYKHTLVQDTLKLYEVGYLLVFSHEYAPSKRHLNALDELGLQWCLQKDAEFYLEGCTGLEDWNIKEFSNGN